MAQERKKIVVLGGGYAGVTVASKLDGTKGMDVTLVSPHTDFLLHKIASLRTAVKGGTWVDRVLVPISSSVVNGKIIKGAATSVDAKARTVKLSTGEEIKYDVLVLATGSRNFSPGDVPVNVTDVAGAKAYFAKVQASIKKTKNVTIVGAGAVGLELAAEIREFGQPGAKITIVTREKGILTDGMTYKKSGLEAIMKDLAALNISVIFGDEVTSSEFPADLSNGFPIVETPEGITLKSGKKLDSDTLIYAAGSHLNTEFLPSEWLDAKTKEVIVNAETLQLTAHPEIFAVGDIAKTGFAKRGYFAKEDGKVVVKNVIQVLSGKAPTNKIQRMNLILLSLGSKGGRTLLPFATFGPWVSAKIKSKDLFTKAFWKDLAPHAAVPQAS